MEVQRAFLVFGSIALALYLQSVNHGGAGWVVMALGAVAFVMSLKAEKK